ncbi:MAG: hypothetical protein ACEY3M_15435 [Wolbachia sp.]
MERKQWLEIFSTINADDESNVIEKIKEGLKEKDEGEYEKKVSMKSGKELILV